MVAGSANCALGGRASSASLAVSVCQCHLGRTALRTYSTSPQLRGHRHAQTHTHAWMHTRKQGQTCTPHLCSIHKYAWYEQRTHIWRYTHAHTHTGTAGRWQLTICALPLTSPSASFSALVFAFINARSLSSFPHFLSSFPVLSDEFFRPEIPTLCHCYLCTDTWHVFSLDFSRRIGLGSVIICFQVELSKTASLPSLSGFSLELGSLCQSDI